MSCFLNCRSFITAGLAQSLVIAGLGSAFAENLSCSWYHGVHHLRPLELRPSHCPSQDTIDRYLFDLRRHPRRLPHRRHRRLLRRPRRHRVEHCHPRSQLHRLHRHLEHATELLQIQPQGLRFCSFALICTSQFPTLSPHLLLSPFQAIARTLLTLLKFHLKGMLCCVSEDWNTLEGCSRARWPMSQDYQRGDTLES